MIEQHDDGGSGEAPVLLAYEAFARRDLWALGRLVAADVQVLWRRHGQPVLTVGRDHLLERLAHIINDTEGTAAAELVACYRTATDRVLALHDEKARWRGREHHARAGVLVTVGSGSIRRLEWLERMTAVPLDSCSAGVERTPVSVNSPRPDVGHVP